MNKKYIVLQADRKDCGPCALLSIIKYYNGYISLEKLREECCTTIDGTTVYHLVRTSKKYGFDAFAKKISVDDLNKIQLPAIVHIKYENGSTHFMVVYKISNSKIYLMDPAKGNVKITIDEFKVIFTGIIIEMFPKNNIVLLEKGTNIYTFFIQLFKSYKRLCLNIICCNTLYAIIAILSGTYFKFLYNAVENTNDFSLIKIEIYLFLVVIIFKILINYFSQYYQNHLNKNIDVGLLKKFITHIFHLPLKVINTRSSGEIITRIGEINQVKDFFSQLFVNGFLNILIIILSSVMLSVICGSMGLYIILIMIIYFIVNVLLSPYYYKRIKQNIEYQTSVNAKLSEKISMLNSINNLKSRDFELQNIEENVCELLFDNYELNSEFITINTLKESIFEIGIFLVNILGFIRVYNNQLTLIDIVLFNQILPYFTSSIQDISSLFPKYNYLRATFNKICDFIDLEEENIGIEEEFKDGDIEFKNINYSYNKYSNLINNFSLELKKGQKIFLLGKSGTGKSTILNLLNRNINIDSGSILINQKDIRDYSIATIKKNIVYVGQKESLYDDTIKNNIIYDGDSNLFDQAAKVCMLDDIISTKPFRYDTGIDTQTSNISGGEAQRIILARALCRPFSILLLDEALSEVDFETEAKIIKNIKEEYSEKTIIYVSHKNQSFLFDRVCNMEMINEN